MSTKNEIVLFPSQQKIFWRTRQTKIKINKKKQREKETIMYLELHALRQESNRELQKT